MKSGTNYEQGTILLVPFPFTDLSTTKKRPVLVLSRNNDDEEDLVTCAITSKLKDGPFAFKITNHNLETGRLPKESTVLVSKLFTLEKSLIIRELAKIDNETLAKIKSMFYNIV